ncbi:MAG TPA: acetate/propionate family kinase [Candidatus Eisenbacteria bacterium]
MSILTVNAGSSTLKASLFEDAVGRELASVTVGRASGDGALDEAFLALAAEAPVAAAAVTAVGHRVVHGGPSLLAATRIDTKVKTAIAEQSEFAPLHNPPALEAIEAAERRFPDVPHVAAFDTAYFGRLPRHAAVYPLPYEWYSDWGVHRYGFHGLSHAYCAGRAVEMLGSDPGRLRIVVLHLGNGCSASGVRGGTPIATTMGFTPMEGLMMGTRSGSVDPGIVLYAARHRGLSPDELDHALNHASGLLGVSGVSGDFRQVETAARSGNERARLALAIYADRVRASIGSLAVAMGGVDALVFTAGVGENAASLRADVCAGLDCLGLRIDPERNSARGPDADVAVAGSPGRILVIRTREALMVARETRRLALERAA